MLVLTAREGEGGIGDVACLEVGDVDMSPEEGNLDMELQRITGLLVEQGSDFLHALHALLHVEGDEVALRIVRNVVSVVVVVNAVLIAYQFFKRKLILYKNMS